MIFSAAGRLNTKLSLVLFVLLLSVILSSCGGGGGGGDSDISEERDPQDQSIARIWNEAALDAIRIDTPRPPVHARNLWHLSAAMYDAWAAYDSIAAGYVFREKVQTPSSDIETARKESISFAAYRVLRERYQLSANADKTISELDSLMKKLGYDPGDSGIEGDSASAIGNRVAQEILAFGETDGSNQSADYADPTYTPVNPPLFLEFPGNDMADPNAWQPLALEVAFSQNGLPLPSGIQPFIGSHWGSVRPFALTRSSSSRPYIDPGPPPMFRTSTDVDVRRMMLEVVEKSSVLTPDLDSQVDISPGAYGNNSLGTDDGTGHALNPITNQPYSPQVVKLGDFGRVLAEYWADGPNSETPPGHWNTIANQISDHPQQSFRYGGDEQLDRLEWDIKLYFSLNAALHDAAVNCWGVKRFYDSVRPISAIRFMATRGQSSEPTQPSYDPGGLPLVPGLTELITDETWPNGRHAGIQCCESLQGVPAPCLDSTGEPGIEVSCVGEVAVFSWPGQPENRSGSYSGVRWNLGKLWTPYQLDTFVTPAFAGYNSGHSTFSRSAAEVLTDFTGSAFFPGGLGEHIVPKDRGLSFEKGPSEEIRLQWATYYDAADQAGQSRIFGGIHIVADDFTGRIAGAQIGKGAFAKAAKYFAGESF